MSTAAWLVPVSGPPIDAIPLGNKDGGLSVGRHERADIRLPNDAVSRAHARLLHHDNHWRLQDLNSRWGTYLNGVRLAADQIVPLSTDDLIRISPWTFNFSDSPRHGRIIDSIDDSAQHQTLVRSIVPGSDSAAAIADELLALLLESATLLHQAQTEMELADALIEASRRGMQLPNAAMLKPVDEKGHMDVVAATHTTPEHAVFSRSLIQAASNGVVAAFTPNDLDISNSIMELRIDAAVCVPLMLGQTVAAYLYLDARGSHFTRSPAQWSSATAFCVALGRIASLALANLKRIDMEKRSAQIEADLRAAATAQRILLPRRELTSGPYHCCAESRPGREVGGDLFDLIPLSDGKLAIALGDVSGKGIAASLLMTATHGFLHAALRDKLPLSKAVTHLNCFLSARLSADKFVTLWVAILDSLANQIEYIDAGHGYAALSNSIGEPRTLNAGDNLPLGVAPNAEFSSIQLPLPTRGNLIVVSDGVIEQAAPDEGCNQRQQFGIERVNQVLSEPADLTTTLDNLFRSVQQHARMKSLSDDATAMLVRW